MQSEDANPSGRDGLHPVPGCLGALAITSVEFHPANALPPIVTTPISTTTNGTVGAVAGASDAATGSGSATPSIPGIPSAAGTSGSTTPTPGPPLPHGRRKPLPTEWLSPRAS